jgi:DNA repair protein RAD57
MKVVFAPHAAETGPGVDGAVEFEVWMGGLRAVGGGRREVDGGRRGERDVEEWGEGKA